jgi:hypothetical protein
MKAEAYGLSALQAFNLCEFVSIPGYRKGSAALCVLGVSRLHYISVRQAALNVRVFCAVRGLIPVLSLCSLRFRHLKLFDTMEINI